MDLKGYKMVLREDLEILWEAHERAKESSTALGKIDKCKMNSRARYLRSYIRESLAESRRRMRLLRKFLTELESIEKDPFKEIKKNRKNRKNNMVDMFS